MKPIIKNMKGFVVLILTVALIISGCSTQGAGISKKEAVAKVGNEFISIEAYNKKFTLIKKDIERMYGDKIWSEDVKGTPYLKVVQEQVLETMINDEAIIQYMDSQNIKISQEEIEKEYKVFEKKLKENKEAEQFFKESGMDAELIKENIKMQKYGSKFQEKVMKKIEVTKKEIQEKKDFYVNNPYVRASHILVDKEETAKDILNKINSGEDFVKLAKEYSQDPGSAQSGGELGIFGQGQMVPEFEQAAFVLKDEEVSGLVKSQYGYHIIKRLPMTDESVKVEIQKEKFPQEMDKELEKIKKDLKVEKYPENIKNQPK
ncbi:peptidylprolyl isomerase [Inediibacterium massiliense]|uniref:peptidylprolyl isomerase n=1 Tax=Inediibacterium massiliense TaxID=1658111 RepID=UPI0018FE4695|nr:peptidylprolyl isomerase [Inediibacterium massiliense]